MVVRKALPGNARRRTKGTEIQNRDLGVQSVASVAELFVWVVALSVNDRV